MFTHWYLQMARKKKVQSRNIYRNMSLYTRHDTPYIWGRLRLNGKVCKKSLKTKNWEEAEQLLFQWKTELLSDPTSPVTEYKQSFKAYSEKLIKKQKLYPMPPSGIEQWTKTKQLLQRPKGLWDFFGDKDIRSINRSMIDDFIIQLPLDKQQLSTDTIRKHIGLLKQILDLADIRINIPKYKGKKSNPRGYLNIENYRMVRDKSKELVGLEWYSSTGKKYSIEEDLHDWIIFMVGSMLRPTVSEVYSLKHSDITVKDLNGSSYLEFLLNRKNQSMRVQTLPTSQYAYRDICKRVPDHMDSDYLFLPRFQNRRTAMQTMSRMFTKLLKECNLEKDQDGNKLTAYSLRHTSITFNLSQKNVDTWDIARRADTSVKMIDEFYYPKRQQDEKLKDFLRA